MTGDLSSARAALERGDWANALEALALIDDHDAPDRSAALELRARAAYGAGEFEAAVQAWEELHAHELDRGDRVAAAQAAAMVAMFLMMDTGLMAPVRGWLRTADRLLDPKTVTPAHALIAMTRTYERFMCGDLDAAREWSARAIELGEATGTDPAIVIGRVSSARVRIYDGDLEGGLAQLEEVGAFLMTGRADPLTTGMMYCELICAAQGLGRHDMASEWTEVMERWRHGAAFGGIHGRCRVHRAEVLRISGPCDEAEAEALGACEELRPWMRREYGWPLVELGNIRLRRGDLAGAEDAFLEAHQHAWSPQPGLALLRLEQGDADAASEMIADAIAHPFDSPSKERPPFGDLRLAPLLDAQSEIEYARGNAEACRDAATRLASIADRFPGGFVSAWSRLAAGRADLLDGDPVAAIGHCRAALEAWTDLGAPYEAATARLVLAAALERSGNSESAHLERRSAASGLAAFGAARRAGVAADDSAPPPSRRSPGLTPAATFARDGRMRIVEFDGATATLKDLKGFRYITRLLAAPGREFHVLDLVAAEHGVLRPEHGTADVTVSAQRADTGLPMLDDEARAAYRRRLGEIDEDIEDARRANDLGRIELAERDRDYLIAELSRAVGLSGRSRTTGGTSERARTSVARSIRYALDQLAAVQPELAARLRRNLRTGTYCAYDPDPVAPITWTL